MRHRHTHAASLCLDSPVCTHVELRAWATRRRHYCTAIAGQVEFYFSEANLKTDKFLQQQMDAEGMWPTRLVAGFAKIKKLTGDESAAGTLRLIKMVEAVKTSTLLVLSADEARIGLKQSGSACGGMAGAFVPGAFSSMHSPMVASAGSTAPSGLGTLTQSDINDLISKYNE
jgi:hypothetical protein